MTLYHPGTSEVGWLADLKEIAEQAGRQVFGEAIRWDVEVVQKTSLKRPDVVIRRDRDGSVIASGEAKRPDAPEGIHPLVTSEVRGALEKAEKLGAQVCFTTNFFEAAVFDVSKSAPNDLDRMHGGLVKIVPERLATSPNWWSSLGTADRNAQVLLGVRHLLEQIKATAAGHVPRDVNEITLHVFSRTTERLLQPLFEALLADRDRGALSLELKRHALRVHLVPEENDQLRFLVAQGIAEVLTAVLFYRNIADHFSLPPLLGGTKPKTAKAFVTRLKRSLEQGREASGDYETILSLSPIAEYVLCNGGAPALVHWTHLVAFVDQLDFTTVTSDVIGSIFERLISPDRRHAMGQHYTNSRLARSMSLWALRQPTDRVADVSCGAGTFLVELHRIMSTKGRSHTTILTQLFGNDMDPFAVHLASINLVTRDIYRGANYPAIRLGDAFDIAPGSGIVDVATLDGNRVSIAWPAEGLDAVVGNPPYAEKPDDLVKVKARLAALGRPAPMGMAAGNLAAWFLVLSAALLKSDGVIALVMPSGVLQNSNLGPWRSWLRRNFDLVVWHCEDDVWFSDARVATCVLLASPRTTDKAFGRLQFVNLRDRVDGGLVTVSGVPSPVENAEVRDISSMDADGDILVEGARPEILLTFSKAPGVRSLNASEGVEYYSGNKLGHAFYELKDLAPDKKTVIRKLRGLSMEVELNRNYLRPLLSSPKDERTGEFTESGRWVLCAPEKVPATGQLGQYIARARKLEVHKQPSIAQRGSNWWSVEWRETQVAIQIHPGFLHQVWWGDEPFVAKNNFHVLAFEDHVAQADRELIAAGLASGWGALCALFVSSEVGCEGVRWLSTAQLGLWPVLNPKAVQKADRAEVLRTFRLFRRLEAKEIPDMDETAIEAWTDLTEAVAKAAGLRKPRVAAEECIAFARDTCERRTRREALALAGRIRKGGSTGRTLAKHVQERLAAVPLAVEVVANLVGGDHHVRLRPATQLAQAALDFGDAEGQLLGEEALSLVLGAGFECAPVPRESDPDYLARDIDSLFSSLLTDLVGPRPADGDPALFTYDEMSAEVRRAATQWLKQEVDKRLS